jgi:hypothetical protein
MAKSRISSREYKTLLRADRFPGHEVAIAKSVTAFWQRFRRAIDDDALDTEGHLSVGERRWIRFYDTSDLCLDRNGYIFRERIDAASGQREVTLKFRHPTATSRPARI